MKYDFFDFRQNLRWRRDGGLQLVSAFFISAPRLGVYYFLSLTLSVVVVVVVMMSPSGNAYMGGQRCPEEMRNSTRLNPEGSVSPS